MLFLLIPFLFAFLILLLLLVCLYPDISGVLSDCFQPAVRLPTRHPSLYSNNPQQTITCHVCLLYFCHTQSHALQNAIGNDIKCNACGSSSDYDDGVFWCCTNELCLLLASGESPCVTDSGHISAAVEEDMTVVILLSVSWEGLETHRHTHQHTHTLFW